MNRKLRTLLKIILMMFALSVFLWDEGSLIAARNGARASGPQLHRAVSPQDRANRSAAELAAQVRHQLAMLPWYNVFDWLEGQVSSNGAVILRGQVVRPTTKIDAETAVKHVEGVTSVENEIEVLPVSTFDNQLRFRLYRSIFNYNSPLYRYALGSVPPIHIIVKNGHVDLKGVVATNMDKQLAYVAANQVPGVFSVRNQLQVEGSHHHRG